MSAVYWNTQARNTVSVTPKRTSDAVKSEDDLKTDITAHKNRLKTFSQFMGLKSGGDLSNNHHSLVQRGPSGAAKPNMSVFEFWPLNVKIRIREGGGCNPQRGCCFSPLLVTGSGHSLLSHPENISISKYESLKIYLIYTLGFVLQKPARYLHGGKHAAARCRVRPDTITVSACGKLSTHSSLTFGSKWNILSEK